MPVRKIRKDAIPTRTRNRNHPLKMIDEWKDVQAVLAHGLKPQEAVQIILSPATVTRLKLKEPEKKFAALVREHVKRLGLAYDVWNQKDPDESRVTYIVGR